MSLEILVSLRTAASAEAPLSPIPFHPILQSMGKVGGGERVAVSMGADTKANTQGTGRALEPGHKAPLESLA